MNTEMVFDEVGQSNVPEQGIRRTVATLRLRPAGGKPFGPKHSCQESSTYSKKNPIQRSQQLVITYQQLIKHAPARMAVVDTAPSG
jgi:hypothetical protein